LGFQINALFIGSIGIGIALKSIKQIGLVLMRQKNI
jgi:hypothetical protein